MKYGFIYLTTCKSNGLMYIGQKQYNNRGDSTYLGSGYILKKLINKYGKNNFTRETIEICANQAELDKQEIYWIALFKKEHGKKCINIALGGLAGGSPILNHPKRKQIIAKISATNKAFDRSNFKPMLGKSHSEKSKEQMRLSAKGRVPYNKGKTMSEEFRNKCSENKKGNTPWNKGKKLTPAQKKNHKGFEINQPSIRRKPIAQIDTITFKIHAIFNSATEAIKITKAKDCYTSARSNLKYTSGGFYWKYVCDITPHQLNTMQL